MLCPTPADKLVDPENRPYFLWDSDLTIDQFREKLIDPDSSVRTYFIGKWTIRTLDLGAYGATSGLDAASVGELETFRQKLIGVLTR